jgi:hypothetical protein
LLLKDVQVVRQDNGGTEPAEDYTSVYEKGNKITNKGQYILCTRKSYQQLGE